MTEKEVMLKVRYVQENDGILSGKDVSIHHRRNDINANEAASGRCRMVYSSIPD